MQGMKAYLLRA